MAIFNTDQSSIFSLNLQNRLCAIRYPKESDKPEQSANPCIRIRFYIVGWSSSLLDIPKSDN